MMHETNPYRPPASITSPALPIQRSPWQSTLALVLVILGTLFYQGFAVLLSISGGAMDQVMGMAFLVTMPLFILWIRELWLHRGQGHRWGLMITVYQVLLYGCTRLISVSSWDWLLMNVVLVVGLLVLCWVSFAFGRTGESS